MGSLTVPMSGSENSRTMRRVDALVSREQLMASPRESSAALIDLGIPTKSSIMIVTDSVLMMN